MLAIILLRTCPSCTIDFCGAMGVVLMLTDLYVLPLILSWKERSKMHLNNLDLCGIIATGEIFNSGGFLCLMSAHLTMEA